MNRIFQQYLKYFLWNKAAKSHFVHLNRVSGQNISTVDDDFCDYLFRNTVPVNRISLDPSINVQKGHPLSNLFDNNISPSVRK